MALMKKEKKEQVEPRGLQRRASTRSKKKLQPEDDVPPAERKPKKAASSRKLKAGKDGPKKKEKKTSSSLLDQVSLIMGSGNDNPKGKKSSNNNNKPSKQRSSIRQTDDSEGAEQPLPKKKAARKKSPQPPSDASPSKATASESTLDFLQSLETANKTRKQQQQQEYEPEPTKKRKKKKIKKTLSASQQQTIQKEIAKRKALKARRKHVDATHVEDDAIEEIGWVGFTVRESKSIMDEAPLVVNEPKKKQKKPKVLRSTCDYSRDYPFNTRKEMEESPSGTYYQHMVAIKKRRFYIHNLFATRTHLFPRVYHFDVDLLQPILDKGEDEWWIKSRLPLYQQEDDEDEDEEEDEDEKGMEVLSIYFGRNEIDQNPDDNDDNSVIFSIASVESVHFSDDDDNNETYKGKLRDKVEVMPGEFKLIRKEEETYEAIEQGNYMSSLCLGCGVALVSVQDAREVACPTCGSITPLNGVCLGKPFGIATGIKRIKVEHMLTPKKSPFAAEGANKKKDAIPQTVTTTTTTNNAGTNSKQPPQAPPKEHNVPPPPTQAKKPLKERKVSELRALCKERGIDTSGMLEKGEMVEALQKYAMARRKKEQQRKAAKPEAAPKGKTGLRVRPSSTSKEAKGPPQAPSAGDKTAMAKAGPTKAASKPGAVRVTAR